MLSSVENMFAFLNVFRASSRRFASIFKDFKVDVHGSIWWPIFCFSFNA